MAALLPGYISVTDADEWAKSSEWAALTDPQKENALSWGRMYIDGFYTCTPAIDSAAPSDSVQIANALLGDYYAQGKLYPNSGSHEADLAGKKIKAGSVEMDKTYATTPGGSPIKGDPFPEVTNLLSSVGCTTSRGTTSAAVKMGRCL